MHFQNALIVCTVFIITSAWSIGLNRYQLKRLNKLFENHKKPINVIGEKQIEQVVEKTFGIEWENFKTNFEYESNESDSSNLYYLLRALAEEDDKSCEKIKVKTLTSSEVDFFLEEFDNICVELHDQPGYLTLKQVSEAFKFWKTINYALNRKLEELHTEYGADYVINAAEFLMIMLEIKPAGVGLTLTQVEMFVRLFKEHQTLLGRIDPVESEKVFKELGITVNDKLKLLFRSALPAEKMLMDLIFVAAELNRAVVEDESKVLSLCEVVSAIFEFKLFDDDSNGVLSPAEYVNFRNVSNTFLIGPAESLNEAQHCLMKFDGINNVNVAEYVEIVFFVD